MPLRHERLGALMDGCFHRRLIEIRVGVDILHIRRLPAERRGHADNVHGHFIFAADVDRGVEAVTSSPASSVNTTIITLCRGLASRW